MVYIDIYYCPRELDGLLTYWKTLYFSKIHSVISGAALVTKYVTLEYKSKTYPNPVNYLKTNIHDLRTCGLRMQRLVY